MTARFKEKVALVTGAGSGIGRAAALAFAAEQARVAVCDIDTTTGEDTAHRVQMAGGEAIFVRADVSRERQVEALVARTIAAYGQLDCSLNNAGIAGPPKAGTVDITEQDWDRVIDVNLKGVWLCMKHEIPAMLKQGGGAIVNMSSIAGLKGAPGMGPAYAASKHAVIGLSRTAALEHARAGIRVNALCAGATRTPLFEHFVELDENTEQRLLAAQPNGRIASPEDIAEVALWLCSDAASFVTGHAMLADGGRLA